MNRSFIFEDQVNDRGRFQKTCLYIHTKITPKLPLPHTHTLRFYQVLFTLFGLKMTNGQRKKNAQESFYCSCFALFFFASFFSSLTVSPKHESLAFIHLGQSKVVSI